MNITSKKFLNLLALGALFVICLISFHQLLFSGEIINATDILTQQYFWNYFIRENLFSDPCFQTWMPYINAGSPFSGGLDLLFQPVMLLTLLVFPAHVAINYEVVFYLFLMGVGMYLYMRELRLSQLSAFLTALFFMLNGEIVSLINAGHVNKIGAIFPTPLVFWTLERALRRKTLSAFLLTGATLGFQFWHSHVQISYYICIAVGLYFVIRVGLLYRRQRDLKQVSRFIVLGVVMVVVFLLLSAVRFLPLISFAQVSERAEGVSYEFATSWSMPPEEIVTYIIPGFFGFRRANHYEDEQNVLDVPYWGRMPFTQTGRYFGILPLLLAGLALCFVRNKPVLTLSVIALIVLLLGMGQYIPIYKLLYTYVPGFNMFRVPQMILFLFAFATSALAGFGAEWLLVDLTEHKTRRLHLFLLGGILIFLLSWLLTIYLSHNDHDLIARFQAALLRKEATQEIAVQRFKNIVAGLLRFDVIFGASLFALSLRLAVSVRLRWFLAAFLALYLVDISWFNAKYVDTIPLEGSVYISENDSIRYFKDHPGMYRILQATNTPDSYGTFNKYLYHHLYSVSGYEAVGVQYYNEYLQNMILGSPLVDLLNVRYIIVPKEAQINKETPEIGKQFGPYTVVMNADAIVLENPHYLPRAFAVHNAVVLTDRDKIFAGLFHSDFNPREVVILEETPNVSMFPENLSSTASHVEITHYFNRTIRLQASMAADGFLVLSEKYYPGWKAYVNGQQTPIYKADYTLQAIFLPKGSHEILFAFQPTQFIIGLFITLITGLGLIGAFFFIRRSQKHSLESKEQATLAVRFSRFRHIYFSRKLIIGLIVFGTFLHLTQYLFNRSLHIDEASLALNIMNRSFSGLLQPLDYNQGAPPGFLLIQRFLVQLFGSHEYVLRLFPFLSAVGSIFLFAFIAPNFISAAGVPLALAFFVLSQPLIIFSSTIKQYSSDVFFALLMYAILIRLRTKNFVLPEIALFAVAGSIAIICSHTAAFVLAGIGTVLLIPCIIQKDWSKSGRLFMAFILWAGSFLLIYLASLRNLGNNQYLTDYWKGAFVPFPPTSVADLLWIPKFFVDFIGYALGLSQAIFDTLLSHSFFKLVTTAFKLLTTGEELFSKEGSKIVILGISWSGVYAVASTVAFIGGITTFLKKREPFWLLTVPLCFTFFASGLGIFPMGQRLLLFLIPATTLFLAEGLVWLKEKVQVTSPGIIIVITGILLAYPMLSASSHLLHPRTDQELRPVLEYVEQQQRKDDLFYIYYGAQGVFKYYAARLEFPKKSLVLGIQARNDWNKYLEDLNQLRGKNRVWLIFSHVFGYEEQFFLQYLDHIGGKQRDTFQGIRASAYLYDLSGISP